jgi:glycosyltransferase involved in cell wall biosynthesis
MVELGLAEADCYSAGYPVIYELVREFDVVTMQRQTQMHHITLAEHISILLGGLAVYDFDDDLLNLDPMNPSYVYWGDNRQQVWEAWCRIRDGEGKIDPRLLSIGIDQVFANARQIRAGFTEMLEAVDLITVSTEYLKGKYSAKTDTPVEVIPNGVRLEDWYGVEPKRVPGTEDKLVIGWAGGHSHKRDLSMITMSVGLALGEDDDAVLVLVGWPGAAGLFSEGIQDRIFTVPWMAMDEYRAYVKGFDIGIAPAARVPQNYGKSPIRVFELGMCGIPVVASETTYGDYVPPGCGYVARTSRQFGKCVRKLIRAGAEKRREMGVRLQQYVLLEHEAKVVARRLAQTYTYHLERKVSDKQVFPTNVGVSHQSSGGV